MIRKISVAISVLVVITLLFTGFSATNEENIELAKNNSAEHSSYVNSESSELAYKTAVIDNIEYVNESSENNTYGFEIAAVALFSILFFIAFCTNKK